jgi:hypothetical protein
MTPYQKQFSSHPVNLLFVHSLIDDRGLSPAQFRVLGHIARRAGNGKAWPAISSIAKVCKLSPKTVRSALKFLKTARLISEEKRSGSTNLYALTQPAQWKPSPLPIDTTPPHSAPGIDCKGGPTNPDQPHPSQSDIGEGDPLKELQEGNPKTQSTGLAETIYQEYPKKVGRPTALKAIQKAVKMHGFEHVLAKTKLFAETCKLDRQFFPHPATFFNQERYNDSPDTWRKDGKCNSTTSHDDPEWWTVDLGSLERKAMAYGAAGESSKARRMHEIIEERRKAK